jgi:Ca-activated chloride channel family protein
VSFQTPAWLLALLAVAAVVVLYVLVQLRRRRYAMRFTNVALLGTLLPRRPGWRRHVAFGLIAASLVALVLSLGAPTMNGRVPRERATVMIALDVSLSMRANDIEPTRFEAMQAAAKQFVDQLPRPINVGLLSFSGTVNTLITPTTDHGAVRTAIDHLQLAESTAIGEAIFTALADIATFQASLGSAAAASPARVVLLSDGYNTVGRDPEQAIAAAVAVHVPVCTIAFGTDNGTLDLDGQSVPVPVDHYTLKKIADRTGGSYAAAASAAEVRKAYADLGSQIGYVLQPRDISDWFVRSALLLTLFGVILSLFWTGRLL